MRIRLLALLFLSSLALGTIGCDGKPCSEPPDYAERDEEVTEQLDELLDSGDVYDNQKKRVFEAHDDLAPERQKFRVAYEKTRSKLIDALVATKVNPEQFRALLDELKGHFMPYVYEVVDVGVKSHRWFTNEQRDKMADEYDQDPEDFDGSWTVDRGIDMAMLKIKATDAQKKLVWKWRDRIVKATDKLYKDQNKLRKALLAEWRADDIDPNAVRKHIDAGADQISNFLYLFGDGAMEVTAALTPEQRMWTNQQVNKMRRCTE